jgi:hypothetical protein
MIARCCVGALSAVLFLSCAQVPKEAVELSATVGRDLSTVYQAHRALAQTLFLRMKHDVNRFVDDVYAPFQIRYVMNRQRELALSTNTEDKRKSIIVALDGAFAPDASPGRQEVALKAMEILVRTIRADIESLRSQLLDSLELQEAEVLGSIDRAYQQLHYANSIVTGHLASVVSVHEAQAEMLQALGVDRDLRKVVGEGVAHASERIADVVDKAQTADDRLAHVEENAGDLKNAIKELQQKLKLNGKEK